MFTTKLKKYITGKDLKTTTEDIAFASFTALVTLKANSLSNSLLVMNGF